MAEKPARILGRITLAMFGVGLGVGLGAFVAWEWIEWAVLPDVDPAQREIVGGIVPLTFLMIGITGAAVVGGIVGIFEGLRISERRQVLFIGLGCFVGAIVLVFVVGVFVGFTGGSGDEEGTVTAMELVSLAGLAGIGSLLAGTFTTIFGAK